MVRELKELVDSLASIDTTVDIEDIQQIAGLQPGIDIKIRALREFLLSLNIPHVDEPELKAVIDPTPTVPEVVETLTKLYGHIVFEDRIPVCPSLPGKEIKLFFSTSPKTLSLKLIWHWCTERLSFWHQLHVQYLTPICLIL